MDPRGSMRALLVLVRETGVSVSVMDASPEMLDELAALGLTETGHAHRYTANNETHEWDTVTTHLGIVAHGKFRPIHSEQQEVA
jgi:hypothetical protein